jgi:CDP-diacylglycerol---glycerol-3-phosphate 3-phosphatidyltransferase
VAVRRAHNPDAIATWANALTVGRILMAPVLFAMIPDIGGSWPASIFWILLCSTDFIDGWLARKQGTTRSGAFLDPLADKVLVLGALFMLVATDKFSIVPVLIIAVREVAVSLYRTVAGTRGVSVPARRLAKWKTFSQQIAVGLALLPPTVDHLWMATTVLWVAVVLTVFTGVQYFLVATRRPAPPQQLGRAA